MKKTYSHNAERPPFVSWRAGRDSMRVLLTLCSACHVLQLSFTEQILLHAQLDLAADAKRRREQQVECAADHALGRVLDRHDGELHRARLAAAERLVDARHGERLDRAAEMLAHGLLAERAFRAEIGDTDRLLEPAAGRDDLAKDACHALGGERSRILFRDAPKDL